MGNSDKIKLCFNDGAFKILMLSDIQETSDFNPETMHGIENLLDKTKPNLVLLGGDNCNGHVVKTEKALRKFIDVLARPFEERNIPWAQVWGNHDHDVGIDEKLHQSLYEANEHCISYSAEGVSGEGNFVLPIYGSDSDNVLFNVWGLDSGNNIHEYSKDFFGDMGYLPDKALLPEKECIYKSMWGFVTFDRIMWYYNKSLEMEKSEGHRIPALMITHVPLWEIYNIVHNHEDCNTNGSHPEHFGLGTFNSGLFAACLERGDVKAISAGHSHRNDAEGVYCGISISNDGSIGYSAYGDNDRRGGRVFEISEAEPWNIKTYMVYDKK